MSVRYESNIPRINRELSRKVALGTKAGAELVASAAKQRVPVRTGALRDAIHVEFKGDADWAVVAGDKKAFYGHIVEFGGTRSPAQPFLVPALEERRKAVETAVSKALQTL